MTPRRLIPWTLLTFVGCVTWKPVQIPHSDPNVDAQKRIEQKTEESNIEAFIADHPELDEKTKEGLRNGTLSPGDASVTQPEK